MASGELDEAVSFACAAGEASWIAEDLPPGIKATSEKNCPVFARSFVLDEVPASAMAKVTGLFTRILGIRVKDGGSDVEFKPVFPDSLEWAKGSVRLPCGLVEVEWRREDGKPVYNGRIRRYE